MGYGEIAVALGSKPQVYRRIRDKLWQQKWTCAQHDSYKWIDDISNKLPLLWEQQMLSGTSREKQFSVFGSHSWPRAARGVTAQLADVGPALRQATMSGPG